MTNIMIIRFLLGCSVVIGLNSCTQNESKPNIVFILADDLGYGDVSVNNPVSILPTPAMDQVAAEGMRFTDAHSPSAVCTPTRYGILTGRYSWRTRLKRGVLWGIDSSLFDPNRNTMADLLRSQGYTTGCVGKWHLGMDFRDKDGKMLHDKKEYSQIQGSDEVDYSKNIGNSPLAHGFDFSYVITGSLNMYPYAYIEGDRFTEAATEFQPRTPHRLTVISGGPKAPGFDFEKVMEIFNDQAESFIVNSSKKKAPFFLYFPLTAPHKPVLPTSDFKGKSKLGIYGDFVMQVDDAVRRIDKVLEENNLKQNTILVVTSDNGSFMNRYNYIEEDHVDDWKAHGYNYQNHQANYNWRGTKADIYEGGHRVPLLVRWPGNVENGAVCDQTTTLTDWYATFADLLSHKISLNEAEDSFSLLPLLQGEQKWERPPVVHHSSKGMFSIREGKWKLIAGNGSGGREAPKGKAFERPYQLYDLESDPTETKNLIEIKVEIAAELEVSLENIRKNGRSR